MYSGYLSVWNGEVHNKYFFTNLEEVFKLKLKRHDILSIKNLGDVTIASVISEPTSNGKMMIMIHAYI